MSEFREQDLSGSTFEQVDLSGATLRHVTLAGARLEGVDLTGVVMAGVDLIDVEVHADVHRPRHQRRRRRAADRGRARPARAAAREDAAHRPGRLPRGVGRRRASCGTVPTAPSPAPGGSRRPPGQTSCTPRSTGSGRSSRRCATSPSPPSRGSVAASSATPRRGTRSRCRGTRCPTPRGCRATGPYDPRSTRRSRCGTTGWGWCGASSTGSPTSSSPSETAPLVGPGWPPEGRDVPGAGVPADRAQRGVGAPALRRAGPRDPGAARLVTGSAHDVRLLVPQPPGVLADG